MRDMLYRLTCRPYWGMREDENNAKVVKEEDEEGWDAVTCHCQH